MLTHPLKFITIDYSKALKAGVKNVFPEVLIGHDLFHTNQLLTRALLKELTRLQRLHYNTPIKGYNTIRKLSLEAEKTGKLENYLYKNDRYLTEAWEVYRLLFDLQQCKKLSEFNKSWKKIIFQVQNAPWTSKNELHRLLLDLESTQRFTAKNYNKVPLKVFMIWRRILREKRELLEKDKGDFTKAKYCVLMNPKNMNQFERQNLKEHLHSYPWMRKLREILTTFYYQFNLTEKSPRHLTFLRGMLQTDSHTDLVAAINTIIESEAEIFAYRKIWAKYPYLRNKISIRSNHEEKNRKVNKLALNQYGLRNSESARIRLEGILNCSIIVSKSLLASEQ